MPTRRTATLLAISLFFLGVSLSAAPPLLSAQSAPVLGVSLSAPPPPRSGQSAPASIEGTAYPPLYEQLSNAAVNAYSSQNFETAYDGFDDAIADDFVVPAGVFWKIRYVYVPGAYFNGSGPAASVEVRLYTDNAGLPGSVECDYPAQVPIDSAGSFTVDIPPCTLGAGKHWLAVIANMDYTPGGQWGWTASSVQVSDKAVFRNPGGGFGTGCTTWGVRSTCFTSPEPDQAFGLYGEEFLFSDDFESGSDCHWRGDPYIAYFTKGAFTAGDTDIGNHADDASTLISLPFPYQLYDSTFTAANVGSNGYLAFGVANNTFTPSCIPVPTATYAIGPYWTDQCTGACPAVICSGCGIFTKVLGVTPHRVFVIEYRTRYFNSSGDGVPLDYEIRLYEEQLRYSVVYEEINAFTPPDARNLTIGVQQGGGGSFTQFSCEEDTGGSNPPVSDGDALVFVKCPSGQ